jgi:hypothetical protein
MDFNDQDRSGVVTLSAVKGLARWAQRCFAALSMTLPGLGGKFHHRAHTRSVRVAQIQVSAVRYALSVQ